MIRKLIPGVVFFLAFISCHAQGYKINVHIGGLSNDTLLLGYHFGDKQFIVDTLLTDNKGSGTFQGEKKLPGGIYLIVIPQRRYFEVLISDNQYFYVSTDTTQLFSQLKFRNSPENERFVAYQRKMMEAQNLTGEYQSRMRSFPARHDSSGYYKRRLESLDREIKAFLDSLVNIAPGSLLSNIITAMRPLEIPELKLPSFIPNQDSLRMVMGYRYNRDHFFDGFPFTDSCILRTPILHNKLDYYFNRFLFQVPDSLIPAMDKVLDRARAHPSVFQYSLIYLMNHYVNSNIMGMDAVYVHLAEKYYLSGQAPWADSTFLKNLADNVNKTKPNLIGKTAPNLVMESITGEWYALHQVKARYTVLYFWEPNCGFCKEETPRLYDLFRKWKLHGLAVFAVYTQGKKEEWSRYLDEKGFDWINVYDPQNASYFRYYYNVVSTPTLYLLDQDKKIIAKRINVETLGQMLERLFTDKPL